jgi:formylglycine-generating enzyme required for sulfatase activity
VPAGEFLMGSPDGQGQEYEHPQHKVTIKKAFAVGIAPATRGEFASFVEATNYKLDERSNRSWRTPGFDQEDDHPVVYVSWHDAKAYVTWLKEQSGEAFRLLSEAEWEYCCRAGTTTKYSTGDTITAEQANFGPNSRGTTSVSKFPPNPWGLYDIHGNVWEWCEDNWHEGYMASRGRTARSGAEGVGLFAFCAAARDTPIRSASARPTASGSNLSAAKTMSVSVLPERFNLLPPILLTS